MLHAVAGVAVIADEVRELPPAAHGLDGSLVPEHRAVRTVVAYQHPRRLPSTHRLGETGARLLVTVVTLKNAQVGTEKCGGRIAAHLHERRVDEHDRTVGGGGIADHDAFGRALDHAAPRVRRPLVHAPLPGSSVSAGAVLVRPSSSRARPHSGEVSRAARPGAPERPCRRTKRRLEVGCGSTSSRASSSRTLARLLQTGSMSQPADRARRARDTMSP